MFFNFHNLYASSATHLHQCHPKASRKKHNAKLTIAIIESIKSTTIFIYLAFSLNTLSESPDSSLRRYSTPISQGEYLHIDCKISSFLHQQECLVTTKAKIFIMVYYLSFLWVISPNPNSLQRVTTSAKGNTFSHTFFIKCHLSSSVSPFCLPSHEPHHQSS